MELLLRAALLSQADPIRTLWEIRTTIRTVIQVHMDILLQRSITVVIMLGILLQATTLVVIDPTK